MDSLPLVVFLRGWFPMKQRPRSMPRALKKCIIVEGHLFLCIHIKVMVPCNDGAFQHLSRNIAAILSTKQFYPPSTLQHDWTPAIGN